MTINDPALFETPILFLIFNRPEQTREVFNKICEQRPSRLFIAADGPRNDNDTILCAECIDIVSVIDWACEVKTRFRNINMGCGAAPADAITWFFEQVEEGIILEDDCVPNESFFVFCQTLLEKYKDEPQVMLISGTSYQPKPLNNDSYYFSLYPHVWGWASWKRAWAKYNFKLDQESENTRVSVINKTFRNPRERKMWHYNMQLIVNGLDAWDYQLMYWMWKNDGLCIIPWKNMISNIGFGAHATHTFKADAQQSRMQQYQLAAILHPKRVTINAAADRYERYKVLIGPAHQRIFARLNSGFRRLKKIFN